MKRILNRFKRTLGRFGRNQSGVTAIEYGLIAALVSVAIIGGVTLMGGQLQDTFAAITDALSGATPAAAPPPPAGT